ncbi:hypothetical protein HELRODRAFT_162176 [Helobdella robusta]|uniref:Uncharacterized protein n=1 Tax=Helobdella robusta TaxID=6412 RepID=T1ESB8_HELRO|nr:hypothetical protein HELRODRAFT_162176 [Helobdella robusta]ESN98725.1 hypothetical protein HELRODRAFT_162176 [Helobdella robusta]
MGAEGSKEKKKEKHDKKKGGNEKDDKKGKKNEKSKNPNQGKVGATSCDLKVHQLEAELLVNFNTSFSGFFLEIPSISITESTRREMMEKRPTKIGGLNGISIANSAFVNN